MSQSVVFNVVQRNDEWHVLRGQASRTEGRYKSKSDAIERGRELAMREESASLRITLTNGSIQSETAYGKDPSELEGAAAGAGFR
jgi:hypothetical protein